MLTSRSSLACAVLLLVAAGGLRAQHPPYKWEAEDLARTAHILNGGDLLLVRTPDPERFPFSAGAVMSFVPRGKGSAVEFLVNVDQPGIYRMRLRGVMGPSCGNYNFTINGEERGWCAFYRPQTIDMSKDPSVAWGVASKNAEFAAGENRLGFVFQDKQGRQGNLVLDTIELLPDDWKMPTYTFDAFDKQMPAGEKLGPSVVKNPGFEEWLPGESYTAQHQLLRSWSFNSAVPKRSPPMIRDAALAHGGTNCLLLTPDPLEMTAAFYQQINVESGKRYRVSLWARGEGAFTVMFYQPSTAKAEDSQRGMSILPAAGEWGLYTYVFQPSLSGKITNAGFALHVDRGSQVYFDDLAVQEVLP